VIFQVKNTGTALGKTRHQNLDVASLLYLPSRTQIYLAAKSCPQGRERSQEDCATTAAWKDQFSSTTTTRIFCWTRKWTAAYGVSTYSCPQM